MIAHEIAKVCFDNKNPREHCFQRFNSRKNSKRV